MRKVLSLMAVVILFAGINFGLYMTITRRLRNNFSGASQLKMVDVGRYLPHEEESDLARVPSSLHFTDNDDLPVLDGAAALVPVYASVIENCYPEGTVTYEGGVFSDDNLYGENFAGDSVMQYHNTIRGFNAVVDGSTDLFFTAHPSQEQMEYAASQGVELEVVPVGLEAFVFFVNSENPVEDLSTDEIRAIYRNEITNWSEVGGPDLVINPVTRVSGSGSQTMMEHFMEGNMLERRSFFSMFGGSIGYSFRYYLTGIVGNDSVRMLKVNGVFPDEENIRNGTYPLTVNFYVVYRTDNDNPNVERIVDWLLSPEGQEMIGQTGYVGLAQ